MTNDHPNRRWFQFRLRTLLIVVLVLSLPLSWFAVRMERARRQRAAVEAVSELGAIVYYDWEIDYSLPGDPIWPSPTIIYMAADHSWRRLL